MYIIIIHISFNINVANIKRGNPKWLRIFYADHEYELRKLWPEKNSM